MSSRSIVDSWEKCHWKRELYPVSGNIGKMSRSSNRSDPVRHESPVAHLAEACKNERMSRIVLAMSGGVDSSVAAWLLRQAGHEVIGLFMRHGHQETTTCSTSTLRFPAETGLLQRKRRGRCPPCRRAAGNPLLCDQFPAGIRPHHPLLHLRVHVRADAQPVRRLQYVAEIRQAGRLRR